MATNIIKSMINGTYTYQSKNRLSATILPRMQFVPCCNTLKGATNSLLPPAPPTSRTRQTKRKRRRHVPSNAGEKVVGNCDREANLTHLIISSQSKGRCPKSKGRGMTPPEDPAPEPRPARPPEEKQQERKPHEENAEREQVGAASASQPGANSMTFVKKTATAAAAQA